MKTLKFIEFVASNPSALSQPLTEAALAIIEAEVPRSRVNVREQLTWAPEVEVYANCDISDMEGRLDGNWEVNEDGSLLKDVGYEYNTSLEEVSISLREYCDENSEDIFDTINYHSKPWKYMDTLIEDFLKENFTLEQLIDVADDLGIDLDSYDEEQRAELTIDDLIKDVDHSSAFDFLIKKDGFDTELMNAFGDDDYTTSEQYTRPDLEDYSGYYGMEITPVGALRYNQLQSKVDYMRDILDDVNAEFLVGNDRSNHCGGHIHIGVNPNIDFYLTDLIRLLKIGYEHESELVELGERHTNSFASSMHNTWLNFDRELHNLYATYEKIGKMASPMQITALKSWAGIKNMGINISRYMRAGDINTIEFRYASGTIWEKSYSVINYVEKLYDIMEEVITNELVVDWNNEFKLVYKPSSPKILHVFKDKKYIGAIDCGIDPILTKKYRK